VNRSNVSELKEKFMRQKMLCIILTCLVFNTGLIISAVVHSEAPPKVDEQTGSYIESPGASQHRQTSVKYQFEQHGSQHAKDSMNQRNNPMSQYSKDSMNKRNNPMSQYAKDSMNKRNNPGGKYYESVKPGNPASNVTGPQRTFVTIPIIEW
jgi:hypothetical protein